jgi:hypothetical protein
VCLSGKSLPAPWLNAYPPFFKLGNNSTVLERVGGVNCEFDGRKCSFAIDAKRSQ